MILAGDVGGTKTQLALFKKEGPLRPLRLATFPTKEFSSIEALLSRYLSGIKGQPGVISLAVAGPVLKGQVHMVNVGWRFSEKSLARKFALPVHLLNDLEALAFAVPKLRPKDLVKIKPGRQEPKGNIAVIAAGTGLGESFLIRKRTPRPVPVATEGGHAEFFPVDLLTWGLKEFLARQYEHVSLERIISGPGLENIYRYLCHRSGKEASLKKAPQITQAAQNGEALAQRAMEIFVRLYAMEAGNLALRCLATGGVFLGGGIAPKILSFLDSDLFRQSFQDKGRLSSFLSTLPVFVIKHPFPVLLGAALFARENSS